VLFSGSPNTLIQSLKTKVKDLECQLKMTDVPRCLICMVRYRFWVLYVAVHTLPTNIVAVHHQWSGLPCRWCLYLEQSTAMCHICTLCLFSKVASRLSSSGIPARDFRSNFCSEWLCIDSCHLWTLNLFFLLTYLLTCLLTYLPGEMSLVLWHCWQCVWRVKLLLQ